MYCRYRSSGLRASAARQTRGVFHGLEPNEKTNDVLHFDFESTLRAPAARQTRGVFHGLEPMKKRMICCTSILKVRRESEAAKEKFFSRGRFGIMQSNAYICGLNHSSMQQLLRYLFSLLCVVALSSVGALHAADVVAAAPSSESSALVAPSEVSISLRGNQLRVTNADGQTVEVYNITGVKVFVHRVEGDDRTFTLSAERGIYIVKVGKLVRRVTLL